MTFDLGRFITIAAGVAAGEAFSWLMHRRQLRRLKRRRKVVREMMRKTEGLLDQAKEAREQLEEKAQNIRRLQTTRQTHRN